MTRRGGDVLIGALLAGALGCGARVDLLAPADAAWLAAWWEDSAGEVLGGTPPTPADVALRLEAPPGAEVTVFAWRADELAAIHAQVARLPLESEVVAPAEGCAPRLPTPAAYRLVDDRLEPRAAPPPLTSGWLTTACPERPSLGLLFESSCRESRCAPPVARAGRCVFTVAGEGCGAGRIDLRLLPDGSVCADGAPPCAAGATPDELACRVDERECAIRVTVTPTVARLRVEVAELLDFTPRHEPDPKNPHRGFIGDLEQVGGELVVTQLPGQTATHLLECRRAGETRLHFLDPETLAVTRTATAPECLTRLAAHPRGFVGVFGSGRRTIALFGPDAVVERAVAIPGDLGKLVDVLGLPELDRWVVVSQPSTDDRFVFHLFDSELASLGRAELDSGYGEFAARGAGAQIWVLDDKNEAARSFDVVGLRAGPARSHVFGFPNVDNYVHHHAESGRVLISSESALPRVLSFPAEGTPGFAIPFEREGTPGAIATSPVRPDRVVVHLMGPDREGFVSLLDPLAPRFEPPAVDCGFGAASRHRVDARGRVWLALPARGQVARVEVR